MIYRWYVRIIYLATLLALTVFLGAAIYAYDPARGIMSRKGTPGG